MWTCFPPRVPFFYAGTPFCVEVGPTRDHSHASTNESRFINHDPQRVNRTLEHGQYWGRQLSKYARTEFRPAEGSLMLFAYYTA